MSLHKLPVSVILMLGVMFVPVRSDAGPLSITGDAEACFGIACTPRDTSSMGSLISYTSSVAADFSGYTDAEMADWL
jgi:hypothetical protein